MTFCLTTGGKRVLLKSLMQPANDRWENLDGDLELLMEIEELLTGEGKRY